MIQKLRNGHWPIFFLSSFSSLGNLFLPLILVRLLSTEEVGIYKIFFLHLAAIPFIVMAGGPIHSVYYWAGKKDKEKQGQLNATWTLTVLLSSLILIIGFPLRNHLSGLLGLPVEYIDIMLITGFLTCPSSHYSETTIAIGYTLRGSLYGTIFEVLKAIGIILIAYYTGELYWAVAFYAGLFSIKLVIGFWFNKRFNHITFELNLPTMKKAMLYCLPVSVTGLMGFFIDKIDLLILSGKLGADAFAYYSLGCLVIPPLYILEMSVQKTLIPKLSQNYLERNYKEAARNFRKSISDIGFLIIPSIFGLCTFAVPIVSLLYTEQYVASAPYLQIFALTYLLLMIPHDSVPRSTGMTSWILKVYCIITVITLPVMYLAAGTLDTRMVLLLSLILKFIPKLWGLKFSKQIMNWTWSEMFPLKKLGQYVALSMALSIASYLVKGYFESEIKWFITCGPIFAMIYLLLSLKGPKAGESVALADAN